ncbi:MAG: HEAT repeat domain-containing protein [Proteobacteria bacterium]|nr:HEAT repeat domain-containing protein [Pseudomonadota bacterium]
MIGTEASAGTLAGMLSDLRTSDMARYALERIDGKAVDSVLRSALGKTSGKIQVGIIGSLGMRRDAKSTAALTELLNSTDLMVAEAAVSALGRIGTSKAAKSLKQAGKNMVGKPLRVKVMDAYLQCADQLAKQGKKSEAKGMYEEIYSVGVTKMIRVAAFKGLVGVSGSESVKLVVTAMHSDDRMLRGVAIGLVRSISGTGIVRAASSELQGLDQTSQIQLLTALADRGDGAALGAVTAAAGGSGAVQVAALEALGSVGDRTSVMFLAASAAAEGGEVRQAAQQSLYRLRGAGVDRAIVASVRQATPAVKVELIRSVGKRRIASGRSVLLMEAGSSDRDVRLESIKALREVSVSEDLSKLVDLLVAAKDDTQRRETENTLVAVANRIDSKNQRARTILAAYPKVKEVNAQSSLLRVMGRIGDSTALPAIRLALKGGDAKVTDAAVDALASWPGAEPMADVLAIAKSETNLRRQVVALKGYITMVALPSGRSKAETTGLLAGAFDLARRADEKRAVLGVLPEFSCSEALKLAESALEDRSVANEAKAAVGKIKRAMR